MILSLNNQISSKASGITCYSVHSVIEKGSGEYISLGISISIETDIPSKF
jgi:hypothetical protein